VNAFVRLTKLSNLGSPDSALAIARWADLIGPLNQKSVKVSGSSRSLYRCQLLLPVFWKDRSTIQICGTVMGDLLNGTLQGDAALNFLAKFVSPMEPSKTDQSENEVERL
jgi:hypothetical protein